MAKSIAISLQQMTLKLSVLEAQREEKRRRMEDLFRQSQLIAEQMKTVEGELMDLDKRIDGLEKEISSQNAGRQISEESNIIQEDARDRLAQHSIDPSEEQQRIISSPTHVVKDEILTDPVTMTMNDDENIPDPATQTQAAHDDTENLILYQRLSRGNSIGPLELVETKPPSRKRPPPSRQSEQASSTPLPTVLNAATTASRPKGGTLESFLVGAGSKSSTNVREQQQVETLPSETAYDHANPQSSTHARLHPPAATATAPLGVPLHQKYSETFPWTEQMIHHLHNTFRIQSFRDHQQEIIDATMSGNDVFVIMRTGGGKSLTYQLPALLEGRGSQRKVTFVISPLLSLIQDQVEQMNAFAQGSAVSFTSGMPGGNTEHARRWGLVRDPSQGICLVFVTPEKVSKSSKLRSEMEKLYAQGRLGRFVVDECHCASQWGHDFRPDYAQLGTLKSHFPSIPMVATTATASNTVRDDVCRILRLNSKYRFFRSAANRPNLHYAIRSKPEGRDAIIEDMAAFIKEKHPRSAGIVYTFSRKDADNVAESLCDYGVVARAYHSDVSTSIKEHIHKSWMRNETQVVVATIAFGLGINKPDVRFVLHHSISKTLEAYYQESGRAGRDGKDADCILYYSPKDVPKMLKLVHGTSSDHAFWPMVQYAQESGTDAVCRAMMMAHLGEPDCPNPEEVSRLNEGITTDRRDVGIHVQTAVQLLTEKIKEGEDLTLPMLVKEWRAKPDNAHECVRRNPPSKDGLTSDDCERIIIAALLKDILAPNPVWNAYDTAIYLRLGSKGLACASSKDPHMVMAFPKREEKKKTSTAARKSIPEQEGGWITSKRKTSTKRVQQQTKKKRPGKKKKTTVKKPKIDQSRTASKGSASNLNGAREVIELSSDDEVRPGRNPADHDQLWDDEESTDGEYEFEE